MVCKVQLQKSNGNSQLDLLYPGKWCDLAQCNVFKAIKHLLRKHLTVGFNLNLVKFSFFSRFIDKKVFLNIGLVRFFLTCYGQKRVEQSNLINYKII